VRLIFGWLAARSTSAGKSEQRKNEQSAFSLVWDVDLSDHAR
jgi:hypothetical protein